jgi:hypothetical protein
MKVSTILLLALARATIAMATPSPVSVDPSLITAPPVYPVGDALLGQPGYGMSPLKRSPFEDDPGVPLEKRQAAPTCALLNGTPLWCNVGAYCATLTQANYYGFACCVSGQVCAVETACVPYSMMAACTADYNCQNNPYIFKW